MTSESLLKDALEYLTVPIDAPVLQRLPTGERAQISTQRRWVNAPGIMGYGIAEKTTLGKPVGEVTLKIYVAEKKPEESLESNEVVLSTVSIPGLGNIPTDVEEIGYQKLQGLTARSRPSMLGYSVGTLGGESGSMGALVRNKASSEVFILSNSHVLARNGFGNRGDVVVQPGPSDGGVEKDRIGILSDWIAFDFESGFNNLCDAAIAQLDRSDLVDNSIPEIGTPQGVGLTISRGMEVQKTGRTSEHTTGIIQDINYRTFMSFDKPDGSMGAAGFRDQVLCTRYSDGGDSGSLVCDMKGNAVGLHWCGSSKVSVFSPIGFILDTLELELVGVVAPD